MRECRSVHYIVSIASAFDSLGYLQNEKNHKPREKERFKKYNIEINK